MHSILEEARLIASEFSTKYSFVFQNKHKLSFQNVNLKKTGNDMSKEELLQITLKTNVEPYFYKILKDRLAQADFFESSKISGNVEHHVEFIWLEPATNDHQK